MTIDDTGNSGEIMIGLLFSLLNWMLSLTIQFAVLSVRFLIFSMVLFGRLGLWALHAASRASRR